MEKPSVISHFYKIVLRKKQGDDALQVLLWTDLRFELRTKWDWYFKYRAALLRVQHPRFYIEETYGHQVATKRTESQVLESRLRAKKAKITEITNKIQKYKDQYSELFPITEDYAYQIAIERLSRLKSELWKMQTELDAAKQTEAVEA